MEFVPIILETYETYKLVVKHYSKITDRVENLLMRLYVQFHPEVLNRPNQVTLDEITKYCQFLEKKDKATKMPKTKARNSLGVQSQSSVGSSTQGTIQSSQPSTSQSILN